MNFKIQGKRYFESGGLWGYNMKTPAIIEIFTGKTRKFSYNSIEETHNQIIATAEFKIPNYKFIIKDKYINKSSQCIWFFRTIDGFCINSKDNKIEGINIGFELNAEIQKECQWRFCLPSIHYTKSEEIDENKTITFMEDRLAGNLISAFNVTEKKLYAITKCSSARWTTPPIRSKGQNKYLHKTENASLGYKKYKDGNISILAFWPYYEGKKSVALNAEGTPVTAFYPLDGENIHMEMVYKIEIKDCESFSEGVCGTFANLANYLDDKQQVINLPFTLEEAIGYRITSLGRSYKEFDKNGAGFFFHFDPRNGYDSLPSGFGTSFNKIPHDSYAHILEYGFTGRQINAALIMAQNKGKEWINRGEKVVDFFIENCITENGWLYSLYDLDEKLPFFSFGDEMAPKLHYISRTTDKGNYLRTMVEPMNDVLECYQWYRNNNKEKRRWFDCVIRFANFLVEKQNKDGSWYRAYQPNGMIANIGGDDLLNECEREKGIKAATAIPIVFLCNLCKELIYQGLDSSIYERAVKKAGEYIIENSINIEHYQGGTLDNPNVIDKEAAQYAMAGLYHLYTLTGLNKYLEGAEKAARIFVTWNYIWNAPTEPGTYLHSKQFKTKGYGGINSIWGGGVVDIYSLFHIGELYLIGKEMRKEFYCKMAEWISIGTQQILSFPQDDMAFADIGMQPEGFGICNQGIDEGMIAKGDIWGTLGWIYSAGIYGLSRYLEAKNEIEH